MFYLYRLCQKDEISFDVLDNNGNNVEAPFDFVESTFHFVERIVRLVSRIRQCCFDIVAGVNVAGVTYLLKRDVKQPVLHIQITLFGLTWNKSDI